MMPKYTVTVHVGGGAQMAFPNPACDPPLGWMLCHAPDLNHPDAGRFSAASVVGSYTYLLSPQISTTEAIRRLRLLRQAMLAHTPERTSGVEEVRRG